MSATIVLEQVRLYGEGDPVDVVITDGVITRIGDVDRAGLPEDAEVVPSADLVALPGFVDLHTHLREPGREDTETIETGSVAAALGGYTAVFAMANTDPVADNARRRRARRPARPRGRAGRRSPGRGGDRRPRR